jgi:hypothetical protein
MTDCSRGRHVCRHLLVGLVLAGSMLPPSHACAHEVLTSSAANLRWHAPAKSVTVTFLGKDEKETAVLALKKAAVLDSEVLILSDASAITLVTGEATRIAYTVQANASGTTTRLKLGGGESAELLFNGKEDAGLRAKWIQAVASSDKTLSIELKDATFATVKFEPRALEKGTADAQAAPPAPVKPAEPVRSGGAKAPDPQAGGGGLPGIVAPGRPATSQPAVSDQVRQAAQDALETIRGMGLSQQQGGYPRFMRSTEAAHGPFNEAIANIKADVEAIQRGDDSAVQKFHVHIRDAQQGLDQILAGATGPRGPTVQVPVLKARFAAIEESMTAAEKSSAAADAGRLWEPPGNGDRVAPGTKAAVGEMPDLGAAKPAPDPVAATTKLPIAAPDGTAPRPNPLPDTANLDALKQQARRELAAGRTQEALVHLAAASALDPKDTMLALDVASLQAWFGQDAELAVTIKRVRENAKGTTDPSTPERAAKICVLRPTSDKAQLESALALAHRAVELGRGNGFLPYCQMALGMVEYRNGEYAAADEALTASIDARGTIPQLSGTSAFYRAMSLYRLGKEAEARALAKEAVSKMRPLPADEKNPLAGNVNHDHLILWMAYKEARDLVKFDAAAPGSPDNKPAGEEPRLRLRPISQPHPSAKNGARTHVTFVNRTGNEVKLFWIDTEGRRKPYGSIAPGGRREQQTFGGHVWIVVDTHDSVLAVFDAGNDPAEAIIDAPNPTTRGSMPPPNAQTSK